MANVISVTVYDFNSTGNVKYGTRLMGLPVEGAFIYPVANQARPDSSVFVYSLIKYVNAAPASEPQNGYYTAESVQSIIDKFNA